MSRPTHLRLIHLTIPILLAACGSDAKDSTGAATGTAGATATGGMVAPKAGTGAATAGSGGAVGGNSATVGGATATTTASAGRAAGGAGAGPGAAGLVGAAGASGGSAGATGVANTGGAGTSAGAGGGSANTAGRAPTGGNGGACKAMGWATRDGRTGGAVELTGGGNAMPVVVSAFADLQKYAKDAEPRVIHIDGTLGAGWSGTSGDRLEVGSNKTIVGLHAGTQLKAAIHISGSTNVILRNLVIRGPGSNSDQAWDNLNIEGSAKNVWIDHCEFWDGQDGNADVVKGADNVTFTWNIFGYKTNGGHNFSNLVASSDDEPQSDGKLDITLMFNWFTGVAQRQPRCRYGDIHVVNNLFSRDGQKSDYGISAGKDCKVLTEANHFLEISSPIYTSHASGSAANELRGDNIFENTTGNTTGYGKAFEPPYEYKSVLLEAKEVKARVQEHAGAKLQSPSECSW